MKKNLHLSLLILFCLFSFTLHAYWEEYLEETLSHLHEIPGWCTREKAERMMDLIHQTHPELCVEIGVFGGSSIYPTAKALQYQGYGYVCAIDPWEKQECTKGYEVGDLNYQWWNALDLHQIYLDFKQMLVKFQIFNTCRVMKLTSAEALDHFMDESIDIIHIDGNHTEESALFDVQNWLPKVKKGGYIWFDDVDWPSTRKAVKFLMKHCKLDPDYSWDDPYLLLIKK